MKWEKRGQIFKTEDHGLYYAKSPQAIVFEDFIRVYFSTCLKDGTKLISDVAFVDYDRGFHKILDVSKHPIISPGKLGTFDEDGIFPFSPFRQDDLFYAYISGWTRRVSVSVDSGIGIAASTDRGNTFTRLGDGPVLTASRHEPYLVIDGFVKKFNNIFYMWYIYGTSWQPAPDTDAMERTYKIGYATSENGIDWVKAGVQLIPDRLENECQALPTVIEANNLYHMFYCYRSSFAFRSNNERSYRIGYAYSENLTDWIRDDENAGIAPSKSGWDSGMLCYPNVFKVDEDIYMLYNGNDFGKYGFGLAKLMEV